MTQPGRALIVFNQEITPRDHLIRLTTGGPEPQPIATLVGQQNGLLGAAVPGHLIARTASTGLPVRLRAEVHDSRPTLDDTWDEVVEAPFVPLGIPVALRGVTSEAYPLGLFGEFEPGKPYRVRYCSEGFRQSTPEHYLLQFWPAPPAPDVIVEQSSAAARKLHAAIENAAESLRILEAEIAQIESERATAEPRSPFPPGQSLLIRTDFTDESAWEETVEEAMEPLEVGGMEAVANLRLVDDPQFDSMPVDELRQWVADYSWTFVADSRTIRDREHPILALNNSEFDPELDKYPTLRVVPRQIFWIEANLSIGNMWFSSFASAAESDGVFRGFPD